MKINRINLTIPTAQNKHKPLLYNNILYLMERYKFGGIFTNESIKLNSAPEIVGRILRRMGIKC